MLEIDGAHGEGGGQLLRTAVAIAAIQGTPIRVMNIRARRRNPGLAPQHVAAVRAVAALCDAQCDGVEPRSAATGFGPGRLHGGEFRVDVGTAGSITLVLQAMLPVLVAVQERCRATIRGGTDVRAAPPIDYLRLVLLPLLATMGVRAELAVVRRGYYPRGGGEVQLDVTPAGRLRPFVVETAGAVARIELRAHVTQLAREIAERMDSAARLVLPHNVAVQSEIEVCPSSLSYGPGGAIVLRALTEHTVLGAVATAQRGVRAEQLAGRAAESLARDLQAGATLDVHAADQMPVLLALAQGRSAFRAAKLSARARTAMWLLEQIAATRFRVTPSALGVRVEVEPQAVRSDPPGIKLQRQR